MEFIMSAQDLTANNLRVRLRQFVGEDIESMQSISHSPDLADKYKHKPAQLSRPNRKCYLYEGMQYRSNFKAEEARREKRKRKVSADESNRPPKKQKADPKAKQVAAGAEGTKKFKTKEQQKRLDVWLEYVETSQEELDTHEANIKYHGKFITPVTRETLKDAQHIVNTMQALCDLASDAIKESGECRDWFLG